MLGEELEATAGGVQSIPPEGTGLGQLHGSARQQGFPVHGLGHRIVHVQHRQHQLLRGHGIGGFLQSQAPGQRGEGIQVAPGFSGRGQRAPGVLQVIVTIAGQQIIMFQKIRGGQHDIREIHGIGGHLLMHHHEQILAR